MKIYEKYLLITALTRIPNAPKAMWEDPIALAEWAKKAKIIARETDPLFAIDTPTMRSENFSLCNDLKRTLHYRKIGSFVLNYNTKFYDKTYPCWEDILLQCPDEYIKEGTGLWVDWGTFTKTDGDDKGHGHRGQVTIRVYYKAPLFTKEGMRKLPIKELRSMFEKGDIYWNAPEYPRNAWQFIEREYYRRSDYWSPNYQKYLDPVTVNKNINEFNLPDFKYENKEEYAKNLKELKRKMELNPHAYWKYHYIDE